MPTQSRKLAAIMFTDIVGYTALMGEDEQKAFEVLGQFKSIATPIVQKHNGRWHKDLGDGALCSFASALDAVNSAIVIQQQLNKGMDSKIRIGIHSGDVTFQDGDVFGDGVNIASRIQSEAAPGGICLSESVYKTVRNKEGIKAAFLGKRKLKNVEGLTRLYQISAQGIETKGHTPVKVISLLNAIILSIGLVVLLSTFWVWYFQSSEISQSKAVERYDINLPEDIPLSFIGSAHFGVGQTALAISPDGELLVYAGQIDKTTRLFIRHMDSYEVSELKGTDGAYFPFFSPTGKWIGFFSNGYLKKIPITGSGSITLCQVTNPSGAVWLNDDRIIFANNEGAVLDWIRAEGGEINNLPVEGATGAFGSFNYPNILNEEFIMVSSQWPKGILAISLENGRQFRLTNQGKCPHYLPSGHLSFIDYGRLMVVPFDISNMKTSGEVISVVDGLRTEERTGQVTFSSKGDLIYVPGISAIESELVLCSLDGIEEKLILKSDYYGAFKISSDGKKLNISKQNTMEIYAYDLESLTMTRLTHTSASVNGVWGPGAEEITYNTFDQLYTVDASGINEPIQILNSDNNIFPWGWSSDGKVLMYGESNSATVTDIKFHYLDGAKEDLVLMPNRGSQILASFSPNSDYVAYVSSESGQAKVYVQPFPPTGERWTISSNSGEEPIWSPDEKKLYYRNGQNWHQVLISLEPEFTVISRNKLFSGPYINVPGYSHDITPDGQHFMLLSPVSKAQTSTKIKVVKNWFEEVNRLAPPE